VTPARRETRVRDGLCRAPEGHRTPGCIGVGAKYTALAEPRVTFKIGGPAGSMPAWTPVSAGTTNDSLRIRCESGLVGAGATVWCVARADECPDDEAAA